METDLKAEELWLEEIAQRCELYNNRAYFKGSEVARLLSGLRDSRKIQLEEKQILIQEIEAHTATESKLAAAESKLRQLREGCKLAKEFADTMAGWNKARAISRKLHIALGCSEESCSTCLLESWGADQDGPSQPTEKEG